MVGRPQTTPRDMRVRPLQPPVSGKSFISRSVPLCLCRIPTGTLSAPPPSPSTRYLAVLAKRASRPAVTTRPLGTRSRRLKRRDGRFRKSREGGVLPRMRRYFGAGSDQANSPACPTVKCNVRSTRASEDAARTVSVHGPGRSSHPGLRHMADGGADRQDHRSAWTAQAERLVLVF